MKASLKGRYDNDRSGAAAIVAINAGDVKLRASLTDATFVRGPSFSGLALALEKPGFFIVDYNVPQKVRRTNTTRVSLYLVFSVSNCLGLLARTSAFSS